MAGAFVADPRSLASAPETLGGRFHALQRWRPADRAGSAHRRSASRGFAHRRSPGPHHACGIRTSVAAQRLPDDCGLFPARRLRCDSGIGSPGFVSRSLRHSPGCRSRQKKKRPARDICAFSAPDPRQPSKPPKFLCAIPFSGLRSAIPFAVIITDFLRAGGHDVTDAM